MATTRGRVAKAGGMAVDTGGATARTESTGSGQDVIVRPAFKIAAQISKPTVPASFTGFLDPNSISFWRFVIAAAALGYILSWHIKIGRMKIPV